MVNTNNIEKDNLYKINSNDTAVYDMLHWVSLVLDILPFQEYCHHIINGLILHLGDKGSISWDGQFIGMRE